MEEVEKYTIKNKKGQNVVVVVNRQGPQRGFAFVMHGLSGTKDQEHIKTFAEAFEEEGITTIRFDTTNTLGESDGNYEDATITNYFEDLEDVIAWAKGQEFYQEPFYLAGHSLGGICITLYAEKHPEEIKGLAPISTVVSGKLSLEAHRELDSEDFRKWKETGWREEGIVAKTGRPKRLKWSHMEDRLKYDLLPEVSKLTMSILLIVGENDIRTPPKHQQLLFERLPGRKELHIIKGSPHTFREKEHLKQVKNLFLNWIQSVEKQ